FGYREVPAADDVEARADGQRERDVRLFQLGAAEAIAEVQHAAPWRAVLEAHRGLVRLPRVGIPLVADVRVPALRDVQTHLGEQVRELVRGGRLPRERDLAIL